MAKVKNSSGINISRVFFQNNATQVQNLGNKLFNGYVYNFSFEVGFNGEVSTLTLSLALDRTLKKVKTNADVISKRKSDLSRLNANISNPPSAQNQTPSFSQVIDEDFLIDELYLGSKTTYNVSIVNNDLNFGGQKSYEFRNLRISSYSINKRDNQKIMTVVMKDISFVLDKIYVGVLGQQVALDQRSEVSAIIEKLVINCPQVNQNPGGVTTINNLAQTLHFAESNLANSIRKSVGSNLDVLEDTSKNADKQNFIVIKGKGDKTILNGYGAVIILGEEDFKDGPCDSSETLYSFKALLKAMKTLGIKISSVNNKDTIIDKSQGKIKKSYSGTLREVLNQWCDDYAYSYSIDFTSTDSIKLIGIDLSSPFQKENILTTKLELQTLESTSQEDFVIKSEDFNYDVGNKNLKLYSSVYFKDAKEKTISYETNLGDRSFYAIDLRKSFPQLFADTNSTRRDFCGTGRTYAQVVTSAVLGRFSSRLRQIYNYSIGAFPALGFLPLSNDLIKSKLPLAEDPRLIFQEAVTKILDIEADILYDKIGSPTMDFNFGFYNQDLANQVDKIENFIADFIGKHYWTDEITANEGTLANDSLYASYELNTYPPTQKVYIDQLYVLPVFQEMRYLIQEINSLFSKNKNYFTAFQEFFKLKETTDATCNQAGEAYQRALNDLNTVKKFRFYTTRSSASYGAFEELIKSIQQLDYRIGNVGEKFTIDLGEIYAPQFKELSPVSIAMLQAVLPVDLSAAPIGNFKFGMLCGFKNNIFRFINTTLTNPIELQNTLREKCRILLDLFGQNNSLNQQRNKKNCSRTTLYTVCVLNSEQSLVNNNSSVALQAFANPYNCLGIQINRIFNATTDLILQANVNRTLVNTNNFITLQRTSLDSIYIQDIRSDAPIKYSTTAPFRNKWETIVCPSQNPFFIRLISKTSSETYLPFLNLIQGGLEDPLDLQKIIENDGFSLDLMSNNITPNIRELYGDQSSPSYQFGQGITDTPFIMNYKGYGEATDLQGKPVITPTYEAFTFQDFHKQIKQYFDSRNISFNQPGVSYSVDIFCNSISDALKQFFSVEKGLAKMNITFGENGLSLQLDYQSHPAKAMSMETLIYKMRPNIKLVNTNFFK
jgi:hypothetical protein